jgi:hypothetical protein
MTSTITRSFGLSHSHCGRPDSAPGCLEQFWSNPVLFGWCLLFLLLVNDVSGCKKPSGAVQVHGRATYRGEALKSARVTFFPNTGRQVSTVITDADYSTELSPGDYTVVINVGSDLPPGYKEGDPLPPPPKIVLPPQYSTRAQSTVKATVTEGRDQQIDFELK